MKVSSRVECPCCGDYLESSGCCGLHGVAPKMLAVLKNIEIIVSVNGPAIKNGCRIHSEIQAVIAEAEGGRP